MYVHCLGKFFSNRLSIFVIVEQMKRYQFLCLFFFIALLVSTDAAKGGGGRGASRRSGGRVYKSRMPILIPHRNPASANYYENKDVRQKIFNNDRDMNTMSYLILGGENSESFTL